MNKLFPRLAALSLGGLLLSAPAASAQNVGIGTTQPTAKLDVNGDLKVGSSPAGPAGQIDQSLGGSSTSVAERTAAQSFTMPVSAALNSLTIYLQGPGVSGTLRIYQGTGSSGALVYSQPVTAPASSSAFTAFTTALTTPPMLAAGVYTFVYDFGASNNAITTNVWITSGDPYPGGKITSFAVNDWDLKFNLSYGGSGADALYASAAGKVGLGTTSPAEKLEVAGNVLISGSGNGIIFPDGTRQTTSSTAAAGITTAAPLGGSGTAASPLTVAPASATQAGVLSAADYAAFSNKFTLPSLTSGSVLFSNGTTLAQNNSKLFWDNAGSRLGVGTSAPGTSLAVNGDFSVANMAPGATGQISQTSGSTASWSTRIGQSFTLTSASSLSSVTLYTNNYTLGGGDQSGTLRIYQGTGNSGTPIYSLPVAAPATQSADLALTATLPTPLSLAAGVYTFSFDYASGFPYLHTSSSNLYAGGVLYTGSGANNSSDLKFAVSYTVNALNVQTLFASSTGKVGIGTTNPTFTLDVNGDLRCVGAVNTTSDQRLKQQIRPITGALARVQALRGVRYTFRQQEYPALHLPAGEQIGVLAQEVEALYPELVSTDKDGYKAVNYAQLTPVLIEAIKEQQRQIEQLKGQNATLQADHADLQTLKAQMARLLKQPAAAGSAQAGQ
jgi:hypothetical protein